MGDTLLIFTLTLVLAFIATPLVILFAHKNNMLDVAGERSSHKGVIPRGGGIAIIVSLLVAVSTDTMLNGPPSEPLMIWLLFSLMLGALGLCDDLFHLGVKPRLVTQIVISIAFVIYTGPYSSQFNILLLATAILFTAWSINATNFMDGIDGLVTTQAALIFLILLGLSDGVNWLGVDRFLLMLAGAVIGFLYWNWHPAKIFLGDAGSYFIGFHFAAAVICAPIYGLSVYVVLILLTPLFADASLTLLRRLLNKDGLSEGHRTHVYQLWVASGESHAKVSSALSSILVVFYLPLAVVAKQNANHAIYLFVAGCLFAFMMWLWAYRRIRNISLKNETFQ